MGKKRPLYWVMKDELEFPDERGLGAGEEDIPWTEMPRLRNIREHGATREGGVAKTRAKRWAATPHRGAETLYVNRSLYNCSCVSNNYENKSDFFSLPKGCMGGLWKTLIKS